MPQEQVCELTGLSDEQIAALDSREKQKAFCAFSGDCLRKVYRAPVTEPALL